MVFQWFPHSAMVFRPEKASRNVAFRWWPPFPGQAWTGRPPPPDFWIGLVDHGNMIVMIVILVMIV